MTIFDYFLIIWLFGCPMTNFGPLSSFTQNWPLRFGTKFRREGHQKPRYHKPKLSRKGELVKKKVSNRASNSFNTYVMLCAIWYHLHNLKNVKNTHGGK